jgi:hypothetical protein
MLPLLGVSTLEGMRFYGLSNAFVGVFLACAIWAAAGLWGRRGLESRRGGWSMLAYLIAVAIVVGLGVLGANLGGFITAITTVLVFFFAARPPGLTRRRIAFVPLLVIAGTVLLVVIDTLFLHTHAGRAVTAGSGSFFPMVERKIAIELEQISVFLVPTIILIAAVAVAALWMRRPRPFWKEFWSENRPRAAAFFSLLFGALVALVFNDTGITALGMMMLISVMSLCYYLTARGTPLILPPPATGENNSLTPGG